MFGLIGRKANLLGGSGRRWLNLAAATATTTTNGGAMEELLAQLQSNVQKALAGGGPEAVKRNRSRNKFLPRERIDRLLDPGSSFLELSQVFFFFCCHFRNICNWYIKL